MLSNNGLSINRSFDRSINRCMLLNAQVVAPHLLSLSFEHLTEWVERFIIKISRDQNKNQPFDFVVAFESRLNKLPDAKPSIVFFMLTRTRNLSATIRLPSHEHWLRLRAAPQQNATNVSNKTKQKKVTCKFGICIEKNAFRQWCKQTVIGLNQVVDNDGKEKLVCASSTVYLWLFFRLFPSIMTGKQV